jgi:hypothetical protein
VDVKEKIVKALSRLLEDPYIRLEDDERISGYVVSPRFEGMPSLDRQELIDSALNTAPEPLTPAERRRVLMIAGLTPLEFSAVGARVRVHRVRASGGTVKVVLHGGPSDAEYVRGVFKNQKGVETTKPEYPPGAVGVLMSFEARGPKTDPLTRQKALRLLKSDPYIEILPKA